MDRSNMAVHGECMVSACNLKPDPILLAVDDRIICVCHIPNPYPGIRLQSHD